MSDLALHQYFPGTSVISTADIATLPTPFETLDELASELGIGGLGVKRDDLTSRLYGGNKVRKLDFLLGQAIAEERRAVITFGAYGSNHALATAVHAIAQGLETHVVLSPQEPGPYAKATLLAHAGLGTHIHVAEDWDGSREGARVRRMLWDRDQAEPFIIPMGGTNGRGAFGFVNAALELANELGEEGMPDVVYVPGGTLGTSVGLAVGFAAVGAPTRVECILVTPREIANMNVVKTLSADIIALLNEFDPTFPMLGFSDLNFQMRREFYDPGYGIPTPETNAAVALAANEGLKLETTYTGKAFWALFDDARNGNLAGQRVVFWDTYNSAPLPTPGPVEALPEPLQEYIAECDRLSGDESAELHEEHMTQGDTE